MIYSAIPTEVILEGWGQYEQQLQELNYNGVTMQVELLAPNQAKVVRLISPNPQDYLNPAYTPGQVIHFHANFT